MPSSRAVRLEWTGGGTRFRGGGTALPSAAVEIDGDGRAGPGPMEALLLACAGCAGADVVTILAKMRVELRALAIEVTGVRRDEEPRRYTAVGFRFRMAGTGLDRAKAERAVGLSLEKYCSVVHSLAPDIRVESEIRIE